MKNYDLEEGEEVQEKHEEDFELKASQENKNVKYYFDKCIQFMSASLTPFITVLYGAGMLRVVLSLISYFNADASASTTYQLFNFVSQAPFYFMPILIAYGASRVLKSNPVFAITIAAALLYPDFTTTVSGAKR
ncbi:MAG: hypothetical protein V8S36_08230 [Lachnospiraceae bacterium]